MMQDIDLFMNLFQGQDIIGEELGNILRILGEPKDVKVLTELERDEINALLKLIYASKILGISDLKDLATLYMKLKISYKRKSRKEIVESITSFLELLKSKTSETLKP